MKNEQKMQLQEMRRERLVFLIDNLGVGGQKRLAEALGVAADYVSRMLYPPGKKGKKGISGDMARRVEQFFAVQIGWLDGLAQTEKRRVRQTPTPRAKIPAKMLPLLAWALPLSHEQKIKGEALCYPAMVQCSSQAYWLPVRDDTMSGSASANYPKGTLILVEPVTAGVTELVSGDKAVAKRYDNGELIFRMYIEDHGQRWLKGLMPGGPILNADECDILGLVLGAWLP
ncbi:LexA family protein [Serratia entomophila]|uniref:LexA family protein n=1 Tax=Serratia entomophila TaxID=42906 RepID=UPI0021797523|nr:S24 family peptidase [Serratia entomophila]CAI0712133.1 Uncharacterised protein [Serratia entomophila]CAI1540500.1 Uncharacterised protein [Serratia entomophila]CAI1680292.1 Uncharacterised protein [Serratia entomophila]